MKSTFHFFYITNAYSDANYTDSGLGKEGGNGRKRTNRTDQVVLRRSFQMTVNDKLREIQERQAQKRREDAEKAKREFRERDEDPEKKSIREEKKKVWDEQIRKIYNPTEEDIEEAVQEQLKKEAETYNRIREKYGKKKGDV